MRPILVSSCLLGRPVRYDGTAAACGHPLLAAWQAEGRILALCPEREGGLPTPRPPAEIVGAGGGAAVLQGRARVRDGAGLDLTAAFLDGARRSLAAARAAGVVLAILKEGSPSCGSGSIHDGGFGGGRIPAQGVTAACLREAGIPVFSEHELEAAARWLAEREAED